MNCFRSKGSKPTKSQPSFKPDMIIEPCPTIVNHNVLLTFPNCKVHLLGSGDALEIANGDFSIVSLVDQGIVLATIIKVGDDLQWPLTKDEPVVKLDSCDYLFSLPMRESEPLSYGVTFVGNSGGIDLGRLDEFLRGNCCFSCSDSNAKMKGLNWKEYAPKIEDYNNFLAKAIAHGTGQVVKGIFMCSNAYINQVQRGGETILTQSIDNRNGGLVGGSMKKMGDGGGGGINRNLKRVRNLSKMTEKMSKVMLDGVGIVTGSAMAPVVRSGPGKKFLAMVPGQVLLASLDAVNRIIDAAEIAEKQALTATSGAATRMVSQRFGENAGEATEDVLATAGHTINTAWNIFKIRKAINPAASGLLLKNAQPNFNNVRK